MQSPLIAQQHHYFNTREEIRNSCTLMLITNGITRDYKGLSTFLYVQLQEFAQNAGGSFDDIGYVYVPDVCRGRSDTIQCKLHFAFHGCLMGR